MNLQNPTAAMLVIGDEILSGRTHDSNLRHIAQTLGLVGVELREGRIVRDDHDAIVDAVRALSAKYDYVFTTGGIGPTHDDITADAVAAAFGRSIDVRADARAILADWYDARGLELTEARLRMARIPDGAALVANPVSGAPGFRLENVVVMAGVPRIMHAMLDNVLPTLKHGVALTALTLKLEGALEADLAAPLKALAEAHGDVAFGSYPGPLDASPRYVKVVMRSIDAAAARQAAEAAAAMAAQLGWGVHHADA